MGMEGVVRKAVEAPPSPAAKGREPVKIEIKTPERPLSQPAAANDNFASPVGLKDTVRDFALNKVGSLGDGALKEKLAGFTWGRVNKEKVWETVSSMPEGRAKEWWANYASKQYSKDIETAQTNADSASARLSALGSNDAAGMQQALAEQNSAIGNINEFSKSRSNYAGILKSRFEARLGNIQDPNSPRGMARALETRHAEQEQSIQDLTLALQDAEANLGLFQKAQAEFVGKRAYDTQDQNDAAQNLATLLQNIQSSKSRLEAMVKLRDKDATQLGQLQAQNSRAESELSRWSAIQANGRHGTSAMERPVQKSEVKAEVEKIKPIEAAPSSPPEPIQSQNESGESTGSLARIAELLIEELKSMKELRDSLRGKLEPTIGAEKLKEKIPTAALINLWDAYRDNKPQTERISGKEADAILADNKQMTLEEFGVALAEHTEMKHGKIVDGMDKVANVLKKKMEAVNKAS